MAQERDGAAAAALQRKTAQGQGSGVAARFPLDSNGAVYVGRLCGRYRGR